MYGLLSMAKLAEPLLVVRHMGKVPNQKVAKLLNVHVLVVLVLDKKFALA